MKNDVANEIHVIVIWNQILTGRTIGEGLGSSRSGIADPILAGDVKKDNLGIGAHKPGEVSSEDDIYEQYKKRMMLGYRHRPNPLVNIYIYIYISPLSSVCLYLQIALPIVLSN